MKSIGFTDINVQCKDSNFLYPDMDIAKSEKFMFILCNLWSKGKYFYYYRFITA